MKIDVIDAKFDNLESKKVNIKINKMDRKLNLFSKIDENTEGSAILRGFLGLFCLRNPRKIAYPSVDRANIDG